MLSYQHGYHAGGFADVVKHLTLSRILCYSTGKEKPLFYLETHSGKGIYSLKNQQALKTKEFEEGIALIWKNQKNLPAYFKPYLKCINQLNSSPNLMLYPGSPAIAIDHLRAQDRMTFCELHPREFDQLSTLSHPDKRVFFSHTDGVKSLVSLLPPPERRGVIFIDPSYEIKEEYKTIAQALNLAFKRFQSGVFCLWYPIIDTKLVEKLIRGLKLIPAARTLHVEFYLTSTIQYNMKGCGLWIINPPFPLEEELTICFKALQTCFSPQKSYFKIEKNEGIIK